MDDLSLEIPATKTGGALHRPSSSSPRVPAWLSIAAQAVLWILVTGLLLLFLGPRVLPFKTYAIMSGSMEPTIHVGSLVILLPEDANRLAVGDVITFDPPGFGSELVTHRIAAIERSADGPVITTKGDANQTADTWAIHLQGQGYREVFAIPYLGWLSGALFGKLLLLCAVTLIVSGWLLRRIWRSEPAA